MCRPFHGFFAVIAIICKQIPPDDAADLPAARNVARVAEYSYFFFSHIHRVGK